MENLKQTSKLMVANMDSDEDPINDTKNCK